MLSKIFLVASLLIICASALMRNKIVKTSYDVESSTKLCTYRRGGKGDGLGILSSPNYPNFENNADLSCHYSIDNPESKTIFIEVLNIGTDDKMSNCGGWGELLIYDFYGNSETPIHRFYGSGNKKFEILSRFVDIKYLNHETSCQGFQLAYWFESKVEQLTTERTPKDIKTRLCPMENKYNHYLLSSPHFPNNYDSANLTCIFSIENPESKIIFIEIIDLYFDQQSCEGSGNLKIYDVKSHSNGYVDSKRLMVDFNYGSQNKQFQFSSKKILIEYVNHQSSCKGFQLKYWLSQSVKPLTTKPCTVNKSQRITSVSSPNYPNTQSKANLNCYFSIENSQLKKIIIRIEKLDIHDTCGAGEFLIYKGKSNSNWIDYSSESPLANYSHCLYDFEKDFREKNLFIDFRNERSSCKGFKLSYWSCPE